MSIYRDFFPCNASEATLLASLSGEARDRYIDKRNGGAAVSEASAPESYAIEVTTAGDNGVYSGNALRFRSRKEAETYALDLALRWTAVVDWRVIDSEDSVNREIVNGAVIVV